MIIAIGNRDKNLCLELEDKIHEFFIKNYERLIYKTKSFSGNPTGFLEFCLSKHPAIVFIGTSSSDIPGLGIQMAKEIRADNPFCHIVFFSDEDYIEASVDAFIRPSGYIRAQIDSVVLNQILNNIISEFLNIGVMTLSTKGKTFIVKLSDIICIEKIERKTYITTPNHEIECYETLKNLKSYLNDKFFMCEEGAIVNIDRIISVDFSENKVHLCNNKSVVIARERKKELKDALLKLSGFTHHRQIGLPEISSSIFVLFISLSYALKIVEDFAVRI